MVYNPMPLFAILAASEWDVALTIAISVVGGLMTIIAWLFSRKLEAYDKHLDECRERAVTMGRMEEKLKAVENEVRWVGNCMLSIGTKINAELPIRPEAH